MLQKKYIASKNKRIFVSFFIALLFFIGGCAIMNNAPMHNSNLDVAIKSLSSSDMTLATESTEKLFQAGEHAIPYLISQFSNSSKFYGLCGQKIRISQLEYEPMENWKPDPSVEDQRNSVREVSLYLILAILNKSLYFAEDCKPLVKDGDQKRSLSLALEEVSTLYESSTINGKPLLLSDVEEILNKNNISFKKIGE